MPSDLPQFFQIFFVMNLVKETTECLLRGKKLLMLIMFVIDLIVNLYAYLIRLGKPRLPKRIHTI